MKCVAHARRFEYSKIGHANFGLEFRTGFGLVSDWFRTGYEFRTVQKIHRGNVQPPDGISDCAKNIIRQSSGISDCAKSIIRQSSGMIDRAKISLGIQSDKLCCELANRQSSLYELVVARLPDRKGACQALPPLPRSPGRPRSSARRPAASSVIRFPDGWGLFGARLSTPACPP